MHIHFPMGPRPSLARKGGDVPEIPLDQPMKYKQDQLILNSACITSIPIVKSISVFTFHRCFVINSLMMLSTNVG